MGKGAMSNTSLYTIIWVLTRQALPGFHTLTGANITGHRTQGKRKHTYFKTFLKHILDLTSYGYFNTNMAGITSFYFHQNKKHLKRLRVLVSISFIAQYIVTAIN